MGITQDFKVSVIIPVFNAERYVEEAVNSAINLSETGEVLLIDDGSKDNSLTICKELADRFKGRVHVLRHDNAINKGPAASRNFGIKNASFPYIAFLDADDYYLPNRFEYEKNIFLEKPFVDGVYGCNQAVFENDRVKSSFLSRYESDRMTLNEKLTGEKLFNALLFGGFGRFHTSAITLKKNVFFNVDFFNEKLRIAEDTELWLKLSLKSNLVAGNIYDSISIRRVHGSNSIHQIDKVDRYIREMSQSLFDWALRQSIPFRIKNSCFIALYQSNLRTKFDVKKLFWDQFSRNKSMIFKSFFYKKFHQLYFL